MQSQDKAKAKLVQEGSGKITLGSHPELKSLRPDLEPAPARSSAESQVPVPTAFQNRGCMGTPPYPHRYLTVVPLIAY